MTNTLRPKLSRRGGGLQAGGRGSIIAMARKCGDKTPKSDFVVGEAELLHIYPLVIFVILLYFKLQECNKKAPATAEAISNTKSMKNKVEKRNF